MRFELTVALKYLIPRKRHFSASVISLLSVGIIALVIWLSIVFLSVMKGIETKWTKDLVALSSSIKIVPTEDYSNSYYYRIDEVSLASDYQLKNLRQKLSSKITDPYNPYFDCQLSEDFPSGYTNVEGKCRDIVQDSWKIFTRLSKKYSANLAIYQTGTANLNFLQTNSADRINYVGLFAYLMSYESQHDRLVEPYSFREQEIFREMISRKDVSTVSKTSKDSPSHVELIRLFPEEAIILPKSFKDSGLEIGSRGELTFYSLGLQGLEEQTKEVLVVGFYSPGLSPLGNKTIFTSEQLLSGMNGFGNRSSSFSENGIHFHAPLRLVAKIKKELALLLEKEGLLQFWDVETIFENENFKPIFDQIKSDKLLFSCIAIIIIMVACSNIIAMLLLLVHNKKKEIGILISMGATKFNVISIFGFCGFVTGFLGFVLGSSLAFITLKYLNNILFLFNAIQGRKAFSLALFQNLTANLSLNLFVFIGGTTLIISILSGIIPVLSLSRMKVHEILKLD